MHRVSVNGRMFTAADGTCLSAVLLKSGIALEHPCGGRGVCGKCRVTVNGREELACRYIIRSDITVSVPETEGILSETGTEETGNVTAHMGFALDVGTTTLALALVSLDDGRVVKVLTAANPQRVFGGDVMTRIGYCRQNGPQALHMAVIGAINDMIRQLSVSPVETLWVSGNTTMLHLLFNVDCSAMGVAPYTPAFLEGRRESAASLGIVGVSEVVSLPSFAAFVGADLVAGLHYVGLPEAGKYRLLVDLGTNAEVILYTAGDLLCTAAAAGPCFEGANISCGMSAVSGAVYAYAADGAKTVDDAPARGLCGTGLVDVIAALVTDGTVDNTGFMENGCFVVAEGVTLTQEDVRQFQLAKSAVVSAILTLMARRGISFDAIDRLYIAGGFSAKMNIYSAVICGLLPAELADKCVALRNTSLLGTVKYACGDRDLSPWFQQAEYVDLSADRQFAELYMENMLFSEENGS